VSYREQPNPELDLIIDYIRVNPGCCMEEITGPIMRSCSINRENMTLSQETFLMKYMLFCLELMGEIYCDDHRWFVVVGSCED